MIPKRILKKATMGTAASMRPEAADDARDAHDEGAEPRAASASRMRAESRRPVSSQPAPLRDDEGRRGVSDVAPSRGRSSFRAPSQAPSSREPRSLAPSRSMLAPPRVVNEAEMRRHAAMGSVSIAPASRAPASLAPSSMAPGSMRPRDEADIIAAAAMRVVAGPASWHPLRALRRGMPQSWQRALISSPVEQLFFDTVPPPPRQVFPSDPLMDFRSSDEGNERREHLASYVKFAVAACLLIIAACVATLMFRPSAPATAAPSTSTRALGR